MLLPAINEISILFSIARIYSLYSTARTRVSSRVTNRSYPLHIYIFIARIRHPAIDLSVPIVVIEATPALLQVHWLRKLSAPTRTVASYIHRYFSTREY